jgi:uncharacterized Zn-finger protein
MREVNVRFLTKEGFSMTKDVVTVTTASVACEGNGPVTGHPKVYLTFKPGSDEITCPYCSRLFRRAAGAPPAPSH